MRIDLPCCSFKNCRYCFDGNCTNKTEIEHCEFRMFCKYVGDDYDLDRLRELVTADKDGRCMVLPCNVDDDVYINILGKTLKFLVISVSKIQSTPTFKALHGVKLCYIFKEEDIGKTVFLTRIDAESALAEKGNN